MISREKLAEFCPAGVPFVSGIEQAIKLYLLNNPNRVAHFLAQLAHESNGFMALSENLDLSAAQLREQHPLYFKGATADEYANKPQAIAGLIYSNRMGNGPVGSGDGWNYRGTGLVKIRGKAEYAAATRDIRPLIATCPDFAARPSEVASPEWAPVIAGWKWAATNCSVPADRDNLAVLTQQLTGSQRDMENRAEWLRKAKLVFSGK